MATTRHCGECGELRIITVEMRQREIEAQQHNDEMRAHHTPENEAKCMMEYAKKIISDGGVPILKWTKNGNDPDDDNAPDDDYFIDYYRLRDLPKKHWEALFVFVFKQCPNINVNPIDSFEVIPESTLRQECCDKIGNLREDLIRYHPKFQLSASA
jgi:hypothetical protein